MAQVGILFIQNFDTTKAVRYNTNDIQKTASSPCERPAIICSFFRALRVFSQRWTSSIFVKIASIRSDLGTAQDH